MINKKCGIILLVLIVLCVILGVLLGVLLQRGEAENVKSVPDLPETSPWYGNEEIRIFREYLRIPTVHPNINYEPCVQFLKRQAADLDFLMELPYGMVTTINLTILKGGVQGNVVPPELRAVFDVRLATDVDHDAFERLINQWCAEAGGNITINYLVKTPKAQSTRTDATNPLWVVLENATRQLNISVAPSILSGATDMRFLRRLNIPGFGFSPIINTPILVHDHNEFVHADEYLAGIEVYTKILPNLGAI